MDVAENRIYRNVVQNPLAFARKFDLWSKDFVQWARATPFVVARPFAHARGHRTTAGYTEIPSGHRITRAH